MKNFGSVKDIENIDTLIREAIAIKKNPYSSPLAGKNKTLGLIFMNPSLRTRLSTQKAAMNLGMQVMVMNVDNEGWTLEMEDGALMNGKTVEHIKDAAMVMGQYCDVIGIRCFPNLVNREEDYSEPILTKFMAYCQVPVISLESATLHPLQSLSDMITIHEHRDLKKRPKVLLTWAPHIKALPQAVANSFSEWACASHFNFMITHPKGYELSENFTKGASIIYDQQEALEGADFVYVKNWSSYNDYGKILTQDPSWMLTNEKLKLTNNARVMHCLPVRRNLELSDEVLDGPGSLVMAQAQNRLYAAQAVLKTILENNFNPYKTYTENEAIAHY
jgi:N-succinyl-L-ornithine transcarbamylase